MLAALVLGAESSGTRMLTEFLVRAGCHGDFGHEQRLDSLEFSGLPERIVLRRSLPHGRGVWPNLGDIVSRMQDAGYRVCPLLIVRDLECCVRSQLREGHEATTEAAVANIRSAHLRIYDAGLPTVVLYEAFIRYDAVRDHVAGLLGLKQPEMFFFDANAKYFSEDSDL